MLAFGVHVTRQDDAHLNGVMLYHNNEHLVCVAHTIGTEQLPAPEQVRAREWSRVVWSVMECYVQARGPCDFTKIH